MNDLDYLNRTIHTGPEQVERDFAIQAYRLLTIFFFACGVSLLFKMFFSPDLATMIFTIPFVAIFFFMGFKFCDDRRQLIETNRRFYAGLQQRNKRLRDIYEEILLDQSQKEDVK